MNSDQSAYINKARLSVLQVHEEAMESVLEEAKTRLQSISEDVNGYRKLMEGLAAQAFLTLLESHVGLQCRKKDLSLLQEVLPAAARIYQDKTGQTVKYALDEARFLPESSAGGIIAFGCGGKIICDNTLEKRLELLYDMVSE